MSDRDIITFSVASFLTQAMISFMLVIAGMHGTVWDNNAMQTTATTNIQPFIDRGNQSIIEPGQLNGSISSASTPTNPIAAISDYLGIALNLLWWAGRGLWLVMQVGFSYLTLSVTIGGFAYEAAQTNAMAGLIIGMLSFAVAIWQIATLRYLIKFLSGNRLGVG